MAKPTVSVVIPVHNQPLLAIRCISSLRGQSRLGEIVVIDDFSDDETQAALKNMEDVRVYRNTGSSGFTLSVNRGVKKSIEGYVLILNSDTEAFPKALEYMANNLDDGAAVCGGLLLYPQNHPHPQLRGRVQHAGVAFEHDGIPYHIMAQRHPDSPAVRTWRSINAVTGAAMMVRREIWDKLGGFDGKYAPGAYEDIDFCLGVRKLKQEVIYEPKAVLWHMEHASQTQGNNWFSQQNLQRNLGQLFLKWGKQPCDDSLFYKGIK
jgi:O-antigen biosynthesis protein